MAKFDEILKVEINEFKVGWGNKVDYTTLNKTNTGKALKKALDDALRDGAKREKISYKNDDIEKDFIDDFYIFSTNKKSINEEEYNKLFDDIVEKFKNKMNSLNKEAFATHGYAQKFVSMSFKYMYCFDSSIKTNFKYCKLPLDVFTINWYKKNGTKSIVDRFKDIKYAWSKLDKDLYDDIQKDIDNILKKECDYCVCCGNPKETVHLSNNKLECEFVIWSQERLNDLYKAIKKARKYQERLGITIKQ